MPICVSQENFITMAYKEKNMVQMLKIIKLEFQQGLGNIRFWITLILFSCCFLISLFFSGIWPVTLYYGNGLEMYGGIAFTFANRTRWLAGMQLFMDFFPFVGATSFAYLIVDERKNNYCRQIIQRIGFHKYYWSKILTSGLLAGILGIFCILSLLVISYLGTEGNPFIKEAVDYYKELDLASNYSFSLCWGQKEIKYISNGELWWLLGIMNYFLFGMMFGLLAGIIAFVSDNKIYLFSGPLLFLLMFDKWLRVIKLLFDQDSIANETLGAFYLRSNMFQYGSLIHYFVVLFFIVLFINIAGGMSHIVENRYREGGC